MSTQIIDKGIYSHKYCARIFEMCSYPWYVGRKAVCHGSNAQARDIDTNDILSITRKVQCRKKSKIIQNSCYIFRDIVKVCHSCKFSANCT